jgi:hypothetical protein
MADMSIECPGCRKKWIVTVHAPRRGRIARALGGPSLDPLNYPTFLSDLGAYCAGKSVVTLAGAMEFGLKITDRGAWTSRRGAEAASCLRHLGFDSKVLRDEKGKSFRAWVRSGHPSSTAPSAPGVAPSA